MAIVFELSGVVPPTAQATVGTLPAGTYTVFEDAEGASCDWVVVDTSTLEDVASGIEGGTSTFTTDAPADFAVQVNAFGEGGPFHLVIDSGGPGPGPGPSGGGSYMVYELEKGWGFDGYYIPHFLELNWYFGDNPVTYRGIQKVRIHGLTKGRAGLTMAVCGMQTEYLQDYSEPQIIDLPYHVSYITEQFKDTTNYTDTASRGLSTLLKFEGRMEDITRPEPPHVIQVLAIQSSPDGTGKRSN